jgi:hypothetical protein
MNHIFNKNNVFMHTQSPDQVATVYEFKLANVSRRGRFLIG